MPDATILIVDDDRTTLRLCQRILERAGFRVFTAVDPAVALSLLEQKKPNLLLSDIRMPGMDGFELVGRAKQAIPGLPVLVMTGYKSVENAIQALHRGVDGLILKPFDNTTELVEAVYRVLEESHQKQDAARLQVLRPLFDVTERLLAETSPLALENLILDTLTSLFQSRFAGIFRVNGESHLLERIRAVNDRAVPTDVEEKILRLVLQKSAPVILRSDDLELCDEIRADMQQIGCEAMLIAPVRQNNNQFVLTVCREAGGVPFKETELEMMVIFARQAAVAMENARLYSELKEYVNRVEESQRALIQAEKMAAVGRLVASLAHEINNPLQSVRNCLHLAARKGLDTDQRLHYLDLTGGELERLVKTVRRMLDYYRPGGAQKENVQIRQILDQVLGLIGPQLRDQGIQLHVNITGREVPVWAVADQLQQVIFNLLLNAMDAIEGAEGDPTCVRPAGKEIWIDIAHEGQQVRISIEDSGAGIQKEMQERIFEPFVSTKQQGTGLGLSVSYSIIEKHDGQLRVIPARYGQGACFEVFLPSVKEGKDGKNFNRG